MVGQICDLAGYALDLLVVHFGDPVDRASPLKMSSDYSSSSTYAVISDSQYESWRIESAAQIAAILTI